MPGRPVSPVQSFNTPVRKVIYLDSNKKLIKLKISKYMESNPTDQATKKQMEKNF